jgi:hypothetical protein
MQPTEDLFDPASATRDRSGSIQANHHFSSNVVTDRRDGEQPIGANRPISVFVFDNIWRLLVSYEIQIDIIEPKTDNEGTAAVHRFTPIPRKERHP